MVYNPNIVSEDYSNKKNNSETNVLQMNTAFFLE